jgi:hypothetical protein
VNIDRDQWPLMVQVGLLGLPNRGAAWACFWLSIALAVGFIAIGFVNWPYFFGGLCILPGLWYYLSIRWVDQNSSWS